jgi:hypothetical protein
MILGAESGGKKLVGCCLVTSFLAGANAHCVCSRLFKFQASAFSRGFTERTLALRSPDAAASLVAHRLASRQASALFRPHRWPDSSLCARSIRCRIRYTDCADCSRSFRRPQTAETGKDSGAPKIPEAAMLRISATTPALRREAAPVAEDKSNSTARLCPVQATSIIREIGHFCTASISQAPLRRTETTELTAQTELV